MTVTMMTCLPFLIIPETAGIPRCNPCHRKPRTPNNCTETSHNSAPTAPSQNVRATPGDPSAPSGTCPAGRKLILKLYTEILLGSLRFPFLYQPNQLEIVVFVGDLKLRVDDSKSVPNPKNVASCIHFVRWSTLRCSLENIMRTGSLFLAWRNQIFCFFRHKYMCP